MSSESDVNKKWMKCARKSNEYRQGERSFIQFAKNNGGGGNLFPCPCRHSMNGKGLVSLSEISLHLLKNGVCSVYITWHHHGESSVISAQSTHKENITTECAAGNDVTVGVYEDITEGVDDNVRAEMDENITTDVYENVGTSMCC
ncbi:hypothetical protein MKX01_033507, partial [Papaver californicum]